ncbi:MAG: aminotransferase class I/II-fold pyridoxal phosphate-dependent enzyme [Candidatus Gastranaerophilales bacterium]|nr:aminotransferase class I/II-fold pyridoxal phosphate-dependent enzyme [Candidatus Gastranaerophilales bacterium]
MSIISILKRKNKTTLFTTPSHGGKFCIFHKFYQWYKSDISEVDAYDPQTGVIEAEKKAAKIYGTKYTKFLTNGSTSGILAAVLASGGKRILVWENSHPCHKNACKLANAEIIEYNLPLDEEWGVYKAITSEQVEMLIKDNQPDTIIITSPSYEGMAANIEAISKICKENNVTLIADEAHGALYPFSERLPQSAVKFADFTVQSLHKTAGGINPTALLHSNNIDPAEALNMISTTSPSYPMLATIEANINYLNSTRGRKNLEKLIDNIKALNLPQGGDDITKILIKKESMSGLELSDILFNKYGIEDERTNKVSTMLLCGVGTGVNKLNKLKKALSNLGF